MNRWSTPKPIFAAIDREFHFSIDLCADPDNAKCDRFFLRDESLHADWNVGGWAWINPPYGDTLSEWVRKVARTDQQKIVAILPGRTNPPWWHDYALQATEIRCIRRKFNFDSPSGKSGSPFWGVVLAIFDRAKVGPTKITSWDWREF